MDEDLKTPKEWAKVTGIEVLDADGWRGANGRPFTDEITREEYLYRAEISTVRQTRPFYRETPEEALDEALNRDPEVDEDDEPEEGEE